MQEYQEYLVQKYQDDKIIYRDPKTKKLHRIDGPAVEYANGDKFWYQNGKLHRVDGPAMELSNGTKEWYQNNQRHRVDGPSIEYANGSKYWHQNDQRHRLDGPAVEYKNGDKEYWIDGVKYSEEKFLNKIATQK